MGWTDEGQTDAQVWRRAGRRRHVNSLRRLRAKERQAKVYGLWNFGLGLSQSEIARRLAVNPSTIHRDIVGLGVAYRLVLTQRMSAATIGEMLSRLPPRRKWEAAEHPARPIPQRPHRSRGTPMHTRLTIRLSDSLAHQVETMATERGITVSDVLREAVARLYSAQTHPPHTLADCATALLQGCLPEVQELCTETAVLLDCSLDRVIRAVLSNGLRVPTAAPSADVTSDGSDNVSVDSRQPTLSKQSLRK